MVCLRVLLVYIDLTLLTKCSHITYIAFYTYINKTTLSVNTNHPELSQFVAFICIKSTDTQAHVSLMYIALK